MGIAVFGSVFVDIKGYPLNQFVMDGRNAGKVIQVHGGVCRNVAEDIANMELRPTFISVVDHSGTSTDVIEKLKRHKIETKYIRRTDTGLGTWLAVFNNEGDVVASISQRPDLSEIGNILDEYGDEIISSCDSIVVEMDMTADLLNRIFILADRYDKKVYAVVSNMSIAMERRDLMKRTGCVVCNDQEAGLLFSEDYHGMEPEQLAEIIHERAGNAGYHNVVVTMGEKGAVYTDGTDYGVCPPQRTAVIDTTGAGDAFFAGVAAGLTYGKSLSESCRIGTRLASSVIATKESVSPRFQPEEFGFEPKE
ncbi:MAG: carbohydrate kinase family protein [Bulleidia sp.]